MHLIQNFWALSQHTEGINQLGRFSFLKSIATTWLKETDLEWVDSRIENENVNSEAPCSQLPLALKEMLDKKVSKEAIVDLIRVIQYETLFHVCATIDQVYEVDTPVSNWGLYELNEIENSVTPIDGLHESLLAFDTSENEMRPRKPNNSR